MRNVACGDVILSVEEVDTLDKKLVYRLSVVRNQPLFTYVYAGQVAQHVADGAVFLCGEGRYQIACGVVAVCYFVGFHVHILYLTGFGLHLHAIECLVGKGALCCLVGHAAYHQRCAGHLFAPYHKAKLAFGRSLRVIKDDIFGIANGYNGSPNGRFASRFHHQSAHNAFLSKGWQGKEECKKHQERPRFHDEIELWFVEFYAFVMLVCA